MSQKAPSDPSQPFRRRHKFQVFDLVEDRVLSRSFTIIALVMLPIIMSRLFLMEAMPDIGEVGNLVPDTIISFHIPRSGVAVGQRMLTPMKVLLRDNTSTPVPGVEVTVGIAAVTYAPQFMYCALVGMVQFERFAPLCGHRVMNGIETTDSDGIASFKELYFNGVPGVYHITFGIPSGKTAAISCNVSVSVVPASVTIVPSNRPPATIEIGTKLGAQFAPKAIVYSADGLPLADRPVYALTVGDLRDVGVRAPAVFITGRPGIPHDVYAPHFETDGVWRVTTDARGAAEFDGSMMITTGSSNSITLALYCDGVFALWSELVIAGSLRYTSILGRVPPFPSSAMPADFVVVLDSYLMRSLPQRSIGHLATAAPPDDRVSPLLEIIINTNGAGGSDVLTFTPGQKVFEVLNNVQIKVCTHCPKPPSVAEMSHATGTPTSCLGTSAAHALPDTFLQQFEVGTTSLDEEFVVEGQYMSKFKYLKGCVSTTSDDQGIVKFPNLAFSDHGLPSTYELQFYADSGAFAPLPFAVGATPLFVYADFAPTDSISAVTFDPVCIAAREEMAEKRGQSNIPADSECAVVQLGQPWPPREEAFKVTTLSFDGAFIPGCLVNMEAIDFPAKIQFIDPISLIPSFVPPPRVPAFVPADFRFAGIPKAVFNFFLPHKDGIAKKSAVTYSSAPSTSQSPALLFDIVVARISPQFIPLTGEGLTAVYSVVHLNIMGGGTHGRLADRPLVLAVRVDRFIAAEVNCAPATGMVPSGSYNPTLPLQSQITQLLSQYCGDIVVERPINDAEYVVAEKALTNVQTIIASIYPAWQANISSLPKRRLCVGWMPPNREHRAAFASGMDATYDWYDAANPWTNPSARVPPFCQISDANGRVQFTALKFSYPAIIEYFVFEALDIESYPSSYSQLPAAEQNVQKASLLQAYERCMSSALGAAVRNSTGCVSRHYVATISMPLTMIGTPKAALQATHTGTIPFPMGSDVQSALVNADNNPFILDAPWNSQTANADPLSAAHFVRSPRPIVSLDIRSADPSLYVTGRAAGVATVPISYDAVQVANRLSIGKGPLVKLQQSSVGLVQGFSLAFAGVRSTTLFAIRTMSLVTDSACGQFLASPDGASAANYISIITSNTSTKCTLQAISMSAILYTNETLAAGGGATGLWNPSAIATVVIGQSFSPPLKLQVLGCTGQPLVRQDFSLHARMQRLDADGQWQEDAASQFLRDAASQPQGGAAGVHAFPASFGLDYAREGTYRLVFYIMEAAMLRRLVGKQIADMYDAPPLYSASFVVRGTAAFALSIDGGSVLSNAAAKSVADQGISVRASLIAPRFWQQINSSNTPYSEVWLPPSVRVNIVPATHAMMFGAVPSLRSAIGDAAAAEFSRSNVGSSVNSAVSALQGKALWPGADSNLDAARHKLPSAVSPAASLFLSQLDSNAATWSSAAASQWPGITLQPVCTRTAASYSCTSPTIQFPVSASFPPSVPLVALAFIFGNPIPVAAAPVFFADSVQSVTLLRAPARLHQFVRFDIVCRVANRAGSPVMSAPVDLLLQPIDNLKTTLAPFVTEGDMLKQSNSQGLVIFTVTILRGQSSDLTAACSSQGILSEQSSRMPVFMEATLSVPQNLVPIAAKVTSITVPTGHLRCCSPPSSEGESVVPIINTADKSADRALMDLATLGLANSGGRKFPFVVSDKVSENIQMLLIDHTGQVLQSLIVIESTESKVRGTCILTGFQLNARVESGFYRIVTCYNSQCRIPDQESYVDNRVLDYSNISAVFFLIMLMLAFASPLFFVPNLVDNSRTLFLMPVAVGAVVAFASAAYNLVSLQPLADTIYVNLRSVSPEEILLSTMLQFVCVILVLSSLLQLFVSFLFPNSQFYGSKSNALHALFGRIGAPQAIINGLIALEESKIASIQTEGLFVVQVAPRSSLFSIPQVSVATLIRHYWTMLSGHVLKLYYRVYNQRPYRSTLFERTSDFAFPQRVSSTILLLAVAIVAVSFFLYFIVRKLRSSIVFCRVLLTEAAAFSDTYLWEVLPASLLPFTPDPQSTPLSILIIYDFIANTVARGTGFYLELLSSLALSIAASVIASSLVISLVVLHSLSLYRQEMMLARKGKLDWGPFRGLSGGTHVENAVRYLGTQTVAYVIGWLFIMLVFFAPIFAVSWSPVRRFLISNLQGIVILSVAIVITGAIISKLSRYVTLDERQNIRNRKAFSYLEFFSLPLHYAFGFFSCVWRIVMALSTFLSNITPLSSPLFIYSDPAYASFRAGQYIDHVHNSPAIFAPATSLICQLDRRHIRLHTPTTAEPSLIDLEIRNSEQAEGVRKLIAAWQHLCIFAHNSDEFSLRSRRFESKYSVGIRINTANLIFGAGVKAQKGSGSVNIALYVPPKLSSRADILAHNFEIRQQRIRIRAAAAITQSASDVSVDAKKQKDESWNDPKMYVPGASRVTEFQDKLQKELQPKSFATLPPKAGGSTNLKDMAGGQGVLAFEKELQKLSASKQLAEGVADDDNDEGRSEGRGAAAPAEELPPGLRMGGAAQGEGRAVTRITQTYRMAQNEMHRREVAERIEVGAENIEARLQVRNDLLLSRQTLDSLAKDVRR